MDYKELIEGLRDLHKNYISEFCMDDVLNCDDLCESRNKDCIILQAITAIETLLAEREATVKYGEWIDKGWDGDFSWQIDGHGHCWKVIECSVCGGYACGAVETPFCPRCGAKMDLQNH